MLFKSFIRVQGSQFTLNNSNSSFSSGIQEIVVDAISCSVFLDSLQEVLWGESFSHLEFFIPLSLAFGV